MNKTNEQQPTVQSNEVNVDVKLDPNAASYARVVRIRTGMKAGRLDRCS